VLRDHEQQVLLREQHQLAVAVASALPRAPAVHQIDAREDAAVEAEGVALVRHLAVIFAPFFHRDDEHLPDAHRFAPEIWTGEDAAGGGIYGGDWPLIPFSRGPAVCPARNPVLLLASRMVSAMLQAGPLQLMPADRLRPDRPLPFTLNHCARHRWIDQRPTPHSTCPDSEHRQRPAEHGIRRFDDARHAKHHLPRALAVGEDNRRVPRAGQGRPPAQACRTEFVNASGDGLRDPPIVVGEVVRTEPTPRQHRRIGAIDGSSDERGSQDNLDQREPVSADPQIRRTKRRAAERAQRFAEGMFFGVGQVSDRRPVAEIESADRLSRDEVRRRKRLALGAVRIPGEAPPHPNRVSRSARRKAQA
jgi:hypothetical protein